MINTTPPTPNPPEPDELKKAIDDVRQYNLISTSLSKVLSAAERTQEYYEDCLKHEIALNEISRILGDSGNAENNLIVQAAKDRMRYYYELQEKHNVLEAKLQQVEKERDELLVIDHPCAQNHPFVAFQYNGSCPVCRVTTLAKKLVEVIDKRNHAISCNLHAHWFSEEKRKRQQEIGCDCWKSEALELAKKAGVIE